MKTNAFVSTIAFLLLVASNQAMHAAELTAEEKEAGFVSLFDGEKLSGWREPTKGYVVENGELVCKGGRIYTEKEYSNFELRLDIKLPPNGNNGIGIRTPLTGDPAYAGVELQILDDSGSKYTKLQPYQYHGSIYKVVAAKLGAQKPVGEWNSQQVIVNGSKYKVVLNGTVIIDADVKDMQPKHKGLHRTTGYLALLGHGSPVRFRNIRVREIK